MPSYSSSSSSSSSSQSSSRRHRDKKRRYRQQSIPPPPPPRPAYENVILPEIYKALSGANIDHHKISQTCFQTRMKLRIIQKKPLFVADSEVCIQAIFVNQHKYKNKQQAEKAKQQQKFTLNPFNKLSNKYYAGHQKPQIVFNCHDQAVQQQKPQYPSAYHPAYHYKSYQQFLQRRKSTNILVSCERIEVRKWSIGITNISTCGYYGPVLMIHDYIRINENQNLNKIVQNILFCKELSSILENFRVIDMRKCFTYKSVEENDLAQDKMKQKQQRISFSYYVRDQISNQKATKKSPHVNLDTKGSLISNNQSLSISFIPLGDVQQFNIFKYPIKPKYLCRQKHINFNKFEFTQQSNNDDSPLSSSDLDDQYEIQDQIFMRQRQRNSDQMDEEERENINQENVGMNNVSQIQRRMEQYNIDSQSDDLSDNEDHLKKLYQKKLEKNNI